MKYVAYCAEHRLPLEDGRCLQCKDSHGNTFVLDMQSTYLVPVLSDREATASPPLAEALKYYMAQTHFFLCHQINGHPKSVDDGTCRLCELGRKALSGGGPAQKDNRWRGEP
jgi:hypothetical protein